MCVTNGAPASPWSVATKNLVLDNSWVESERGDLDASPRTEGARFTVAVQRSWGGRRHVNPGLLALATLRGDVRRRLLVAWVEAGNGTASLFAPGSQPQCRIASPHENEIWTGLDPSHDSERPVRSGAPIDAIETMLRIGALEYA